MTNVPNHYDDILFKASREIGIGFDEVDWFADHFRVSHEERESFLNNEIENPKFIYRPLTPRVNYEKDLDGMYELLRVSKAPALVIDLYQHKLAKLKLRTDLIGASLRGDDLAFYETSVGLYGKPRKRYFSYVVKRVLTLCHEAKSKHPAAARRLLRELNKVNVEKIDIDVTVLPPTVINGTPISSVHEVESIFREALERYEIFDWTVEIDESGSRRHFSTNNRLKRVLIPAEEHLLNRPIKPTDVSMRALAEHEVGVHARRASEGARSPLRLLEVGLDSYLKGEEGVASYAQQQIEGADEFYGFDRYLAAGLATGMDGEPRDFRAVFSLMVDYYTLKFEKAEHETHPAPFRAAWDVCVRIFRGTTGQSAGAIYTKDIVYMEGNIGIWDLLTEKPHVFPYLFVGKYNPLLKRHVNSLQTLEIMPVW